jgi:heme-degrading monooxygenase HmoA
VGSRRAGDANSEHRGETGESAKDRFDPAGRDKSFHRAKKPSGDAVRYRNCPRGPRRFPEKNHPFGPRHRMLDRLTKCIPAKTAAEDAKCATPAEWQGAATVIVREWRGRATPARAGDYAAYFSRRVLPELGAVDGFLGASLLEERRSDQVEFVVLTRWASLDAVRAFAGEEIAEAVVHPEAAAILRDFDRTVRHYEVVEDTSREEPELS